MKNIISSDLSTITVNKKMCEELGVNFLPSDE